MSNVDLDKIEQELKLMNINLAEANDIATMVAFPTMPADMDNESRKALKLLREKVIGRAKERTGV